MPENRFLATNSKKLRKEMKETQADFAAHCGLGTGTYNAIENQRSDPKLSSIQKIAAYVDKTVPELLSEDKTDENLSTEERQDT